MLINLREYHRPKSLQEAGRLLSESNGRLRLLAGGTGVVASGDSAVDGVVDLARLGLDTIGVGANGEGLSVGAMVTLQQIVDSVELQHYANGILCHAALRLSVSRMLRNVATLGGELASGGAFSTLAAVVLALDGQIQIYDSPTGTISTQDFFASRDQQLSVSAIITGLTLPPRRGAGGCDLECLATLRSSVPIFCVATSLRREDGVARGVRVALAGGFAGPRRLSSVEEHLGGVSMHGAYLEVLRDLVPPLLEPPTDIRASAAYRRQVAPVLIRRSLQRSWERAGGQL